VGQPMVDSDNFPKGDYNREVETVGHGC
jgi:hypothetical protein